VKSGARAIGVAESYRGQSPDAESTLAAAVVRADRVVDGVAVGRCTVGGTDATGAVVDLVARLERPDARHLFLAGVAPAWYNLLDLHEIHAATHRPVLSVSFEESPGLGAALRREFDGDALDERLAIYDRQPPRTPVSVGDETVRVRAVGLDDAAVREVVAGFTPEGGRPEPVRVARLIARGTDRFRRALDG